MSAGATPSRLVQPTRGYRYAADSLLLVDFAGRKRAAACLDLGTGSGVVAIRLLERDRCDRAIGIEREPELAECARRNRDALGLAARFSVVEGDLRTIVCAGDRGGFDLVVANPPFHPEGSGPPSPDASRAGARHEGDTRLADFVTAARHAVGDDGRFCVVLPAARLLELTELLRAAGLEPQRLGFVHAAADQPARLVLCEATAGRPGLLVIEPMRVA